VINRWRKTRKLVGYVSVDSGCVVITDPCLADRVPSTSEQTEKYTSSLCGQLTPPWFSHSGFGDGGYPVYADVIEAPGKWPRVAALRIVFIDAAELAELNKSEAAKG
jgi:hypothetical protein